MPYADIKKRREYSKKYRESHLEYFKNYRKNHSYPSYPYNPDYYREYSRKYRKTHVEEIKEYLKRNRKRINKLCSIWMKNNREKINSHKRKRRKEDIKFRLSETIRSRIRTLIWKNKKKNFKIAKIVSIKDLGCNTGELKLYLESQFKDGMNWNNHGFYGWHIDHKVPLSSFDLTNRDQMLKAVHYSNLQPMWGKENLKKGNKCI